MRRVTTRAATIARTVTSRVDTSPALTSMADTSRMPTSTAVIRNRQTTRTATTPSPTTTPIVHAAAVFVATATDNSGRLSSLHDYRHGRACPGHPFSRDRKRNVADRSATELLLLLENGSPAQGRG